MSDIDLRAVVARLAVLEAKEAVRGVFNRYLYSLDVGYPDELVQGVFTADAVLEVVNFPPGTMQDLLLTGHDEILPLYTDHTRVAPAIQGGHHAANVAIEVAPDATTGWLSAYFLTAGGGGGYAQGGQYQGEAIPCDDGLWRFRRFRIISGWGWRVAKEAATGTTDAIPAERAWWGGRPAAVRDGTA